MTNSISSPNAIPTPVVLPAVRAMLWLVSGTLVALTLYYFIGVDQGATSVFAGTTVHEFLHDARHFLGFPCH